jgi:hypothetical protein
MKRIIAAVVALIMVLSIALAACVGGSDTTPNFSEGETIYATWPVGMVTDNPDSFSEEDFLSENPGYHSVIINDDATATIGMSPELHDLLETQFYSQIDMVYQSLVDDVDTPYIKEIDYDIDFKEITVIVDSDVYHEALEENYQTILYLGLYAFEYHTLLGKEIGNKVIIIDFETEEELDIINIPDDLLS